MGYSHNGWLYRFWNCFQGIFNNICEQLLYIKLGRGGGENNSKFYIYTYRYYRIL